jgi:hypothetical protein
VKTKRKTSGTPDYVIAFQLVPAARGFWLEIRSSRLLQFELEYFALGVAGYQRRGDARGQTDGFRFRKFIDLGFDVMLVGITNAKFSGGKSAKTRSLEFSKTVPEDFRFEPIRPSSLLPRGATGSKLFISKMRGRKHAREAGPYAGPYWSYGGYMYSPTAPSTPALRRRLKEPKRTKKRSGRKKNGRRSKH